MVRRILVLLLFSAAAGPAAADPATPRAVALGLARGEVSAQEAEEAWLGAGVSPGEARRLLAGLEDVEGRADALDLVDGFGRTSQLLVREPERALPDGRYGVLLVLHGLGGRAHQLLRFAQRVAPPGFVVAAPQAQRLGQGQENEDAGVLGRALQHWWSSRPE
jgi:poly(3-hydroxybutyrate) depolymerase